MSVSLPWIKQDQTFDERNSACHIYTYKEGLLSAVAHDLKIAITRFEIKVGQNQQINARFWPDTCEVLGAVDHDAMVLPNVLKKKDIQQIKKNIQKDVLHTRKYPVISFQGSLEGQMIKGLLELRGKSRMVHTELEVQHDTQNTRIKVVFNLQPSQWGIAPYKALLGAIRLQDRVVLQWSSQL